MRRPPTVCQKTAWAIKPNDGARTAMKQNTSALHAVFHLHQNAVPSCSKLESTSKGSETPVSIFRYSKPPTDLKMLSLVRVLNHARPYSTLKRKSSPFHDLAPILFMFFRSRIDTAHPRIIGHTVYREHVCRGPCIDRMSIGITAQIVEAGDHLVL